MNLIDQIENAFEKKKMPPFGPGDTIRVFAKVKEGEKERLQSFEGIVLRKRGGGLSATFTVRKISYGVGVERIFPLYSPTIDHVEIMSKGKVRRARLYYMRGRKGKKARMETQGFFEGESSSAATSAEQATPKV